jgi:hypothetical protein
LSWFIKTWPEHNNPTPLIDKMAIVPSFHPHGSQSQCLSLTRERQVEERSHIRLKTESFAESKHTTLCVIIFSQETRLWQAQTSE